MRILLIEGNQATRESLCKLLEMQHHQCVMVSDGVDAIKVLRKDKGFDLLVTDFRMPICDGVTLLNWCRGKNFFFPVIFMTPNYELLAREQFALADGRAFLLKKPIKANDLIAALEVNNPSSHSSSTFSL